MKAVIMAACAEEHAEAALSNMNMEARYTVEAWS